MCNTARQQHNHSYCQCNILLNSLYVCFHHLKNSEIARTTFHEIHTLCLLLTHSVSYNAPKTNNYFSKQT